MTGITGTPPFCRRVGGGDGPRLTMLRRWRIYDLPMSLAVGQVFAGYTILRVLGAGAMGTVYLVGHPRLPRQEALKVLPPEFTTDPKYRARFLREADLAASLSHPHIVGIHDRGEQDGQFWISMDYVAGTDAVRLVREQFPGGMPLGEALPIITAVGSALDYAHQRGLLHRDVKPANILLTEPDGQQRRVFLADFGIARRIDDTTRLTATDMAVGTVAYSAPEQLMGQPVDGRADQYALACTAFHLLTGAPPYDYSNIAVVISQHVYAPPPSIGERRPELGGLDPVLARAMAKTPSDRFVSCQEFAHQLGRHLSAASPPISATQAADTQPALGAPAPVPPPPPAPAIRKRPGRRPRVVIGALAAIAALVVAGGIFAGVKLTQHHNPPATAAPNTATAAPNTSTAPNTGPFTGVYRADFGPATGLDDEPTPGATPSTDTYGLRSACRPAGCVATASRLSGATTYASTLVFDEVGGRWVAVGLGSIQCPNTPVEVWEVFTLQPRPDGTLTGQSSGTTSDGCEEKRTVTFTRTADVDVNSLPDPLTLPPRVVSPAEALHGHYHYTRTFTNGHPQQQADDAVTTDCLRTGDRCMSYFHSPSGNAPLVFGGGNWILDVEQDTTCPSGTGPAHLKQTSQYSLPQPPQDPITLLSGHGHQEQTGSCGVDVDFDETYTRTGD
jgi:serine/threonine protein kinase